MADTENNCEGNTGTPVKQDQAVKTFTQQEVDDMMARIRVSLEKKLLKPFQDLGDPNEIREVLKEHERRQQEQQIKKGEFEKTLQEIVGRKDQEIQKRDQIIKEYKIYTPLLNAAATHKAVAPEQVKLLLANQVRLNDDGEVEVIDNSGKPRYSDKGKPLAVEDLVRDFLDANPHFKSAGPATTMTRTNLQPTGAPQIDISKLDMRKPEDRARYKEYRKAQGFV